MKRFYLMLCFLMSIIGSVWGQETKECSFNLGAITSGNSVNLAGADGLILDVSHDMEISEKPKSYFADKERGYRCYAGATFKFTIPSNVIVTSIKFVSNKNGNNVSTLGYVTVTNNDNWEPFTVDKAESYLWNGSLNSDTEFKIQKGSGDGNVYISSIVVTYTYTPITTYDTSFYISDFNYYVGASGIAGDGLDRELAGFNFDYSGGDALKYNGGGILTFRTRNTTQNGSVAISTTNGAKIFSASFTFDKDMTGYYTAKDGDGNDLTSSVSDKVVTVTSATGVSQIVFTKVNVTGTEKDDKEFALSEISLTTDTDMPTGIVTPQLTFASTDITTTVGGGVSNILTTTPGNFAVTYTSSNESVATVNEKTGDVTIVGEGQTTIKAISAETAYYSATSASYTLNVQAATYLEIGKSPAILNASWVDEVYNCKTTTENGNNGGTQIIESAKDGAYIKFDVMPTESGTYVFTAPVATDNTGKSVQLGYINENGDYVVSSTKEITDGNSWKLDENTTKYVWEFYLEKNTRYTFKMSCLTTDETKGDDYRVNVFDMTIKKSENYLTNIWTITEVTNGKKLTINNGQSGLLASGSSATLDGFAKVTFAGQDWTVTYDTNHLKGGKVVGRNTSAVSNGVPNGEYIVIEPIKDGILTLDACHWYGATTNIIKSDGTTIATFKYTENKNQHHYGDHQYLALLNANEKYYVYIDNKQWDFEVEAITFTTAKQETLDYNVADFNYFAGTSVNNGVNNTGLDRKNVRGLDFTIVGDGNSPKFNNIENGLNVSSQSSILTIGIAEGSDKLANSENKIVTVKFTKPNGNSSDGSLKANVEGKWDSGVFTPTTPAAKIAFTGVEDSDFKIGNMAVTTLYEKNYSTITPVLTFEKEAVEAVVGATLTNPLTVKNGDAVIENFRVVYTVSDATVATIEERHGTATITPLKAGKVTVTAAFDGKRWSDANQNNEIYSAAEKKTFTLTVIDETVSFVNSEVVFAVNTSKAYTAATGDDGKVTYTALEGNVNAATSTAGNAMTYTSSDENLIKVNAETGELSLGDNWTAGKTVTITATSAAGQTATYTVKLKFETSIEFGVESVNAHLNVGFVEPKATIVPAGVNLVTYSSNNQKIATVNESTGEVTFPASSTGTVAITATIPDNEYYMGSTDKYDIIVGGAISAGDAALKDYQIVSYQDSKYTANTGHKFTVEKATAGQKIISGEQFTNVPGIELTFGAYTGLGNVNNGDLANLGTTWTLKDTYLAHQTAATYDEETNLPTGGYMAFEPVVSGILTMDLTWYKGQTFVLVDKSTNAIVESYTAGSEYAGEHRFSTPLQAGRTYYLYNKGGKVDGEEVNGVMKFRSASFTPVFLDKVTSIIPSKLTDDGKVMFDIKGADYYNGSSVIPSLSTARHDHDDITYKLSDGKYLNMTADGVFEILEAMEGNNNAVTVTITANIEAKTEAPNDDTDGDTDHMHSSVAVCQVTYTKSDIKFAKESIDVTLFADNKGADIVEPALNYTKDDVTYASSNTNAFTVDANTGNLTVGTNPSGETTITATVNNDDILRYYTNSSAQYKINCKNYSHVKINQTEVEMTVGETGVNILRKGFIEVVHEHLDQLYRLKNDGDLEGDEGKRPVYQTAVVEQFIKNGVESDVSKFFINATKTDTGKNNGSANTNILYVNKVFTMDAKAAGTTTVYVNLEKLAYSKNGQDKNPTITTPFDAVTIPIKVTIKPREFTAENATLRVWDFTKEIDAETLQNFAKSNSNYWTYNQNENTVKTSVIKPTEDEDAEYYKAYDGDKAAFLEGKKAFENHEFVLSVFNENLKQEGSKDVLKLSTFNQSNYDYYINEGGRQHNHELNVVSDITLNKESTIKDNNYMPPVDGSNTNFGENSDKCYRGINLEGKASFLHVPKVDDNISIMMIADHNSEKTDDFLDFASSGSNQAGLIVGPYKMTDGTYAAGYNYNRLTTVINYAPRTDENGIVTEVAVEPAGGQVNVVSVVAGYIATSGILNKGEGKVPTSAETRTDGYTTVVSPYNIDMTGQKVVKAYICDYYGKDNNKVHMKQIKHIPANTPVMLRGYARDLYALFISEGNKAVDPGIDDSFIKNNRLRGNATEDIYVPLEETEVNSDGEVVKYYNYGLSGSKWVKFGTDGTMKAGKAYLRLTEKEWADLQEAMISSAGVSATRLSFEFEDLDVSDDNVSTGIVQVGIQKDVACDGYYYSINGIRIGKEKPASKGVYIYNGKKIVVR
ncbi:MAG: Ig-like domain-containing protein [Prevotella sp.]|nr:Ig-like domain-containing protein [Prevotella sp.]